MLAPQVDDPRDWIQNKSSPYRSAAATREKTSPGKEEDASSTTESPGTRPDRRNCLNAQTPHRGSAAVRLASSGPSVVVTGLHSTPIRPVRCGSVLSKSKSGWASRMPDRSRHAASIPWPARILRHSASSPGSIIPLGAQYHRRASRSARMSMLDCDILANARDRSYSPLMSVPPAEGGPPWRSRGRWPGSPPRWAAPPASACQPLSARVPPSLSSDQRRADRRRPRP